MRWVALLIIFASLPAFIALLHNQPKRRDLAVMAIGFLAFVAGTVQIDAALISWKMWSGPVKGFILSPIDAIAVALIVTRKGRLGKLPFTGILALYLVPLFISLFLSQVPMTSAFSFLQYVRMVVVFVALTGELGRPGAIKSLLIGLSLGLCWQAGFVIEQKLSGAVQAAGTLPHQNILGLMAELAILPVMAAVLEGEKSKVLYAGIISGLIIAAGGGSRGTMAFLVVGIVILLVLSLVRRATPHKWKILALGVLAALVFVPLGFATLSDRFGSGTFVIVETEREAFERAARAMARDNPLGVGANQFVIKNNTSGYAAEAGLAWNEANRAAPVHNSYLLARAEMGYAGQLAFFLLIAVPMAAGMRYAFKDRRAKTNGIALGSASAILAVAIHINYEYAWFVEQPQRLFFINVAILAGAIRAAQLASRARPAQPLPAHAEPARAAVAALANQTSATRNPHSGSRMPLRMPIRPGRRDANTQG